MAMFKMDLPKGSVLWIIEHPNPPMYGYAGPVREDDPNKLYQAMTSPTPKAIKWGTAIGKEWVFMVPLLRAMGFKVTEYPPTDWQRYANGYLYYAIGINIITIRKWQYDDARYSYRVKPEVQAFYDQQQNRKFALMLKESMEFNTETLIQPDQPIGDDVGFEPGYEELAM